MQPPFTSKELYMMNGGQQSFISRDGFGDLYNATPLEEQQWKKDVIARSIASIENDDDRSVLESSISNLTYHKYEGLEDLLLANIGNTSPARQVVFASALWNATKFDSRFNLIFPILHKYKAGCLENVFEGINNLKNHVAANHFLVYCLVGDDEALTEQAQKTLAIWAWSGLPVLREDKLLDTLHYENKGSPAHQTAIEGLKHILSIHK